MLYHIPFTKKKFQRRKRCLKIVISPNPPLAPPPMAQKIAAGVSVSTKT